MAEDLIGGETKYQVLRELPIGEGGQGVVRKVRRISDGKIFVAKNNKGSFEDALAEANRLKQYNHKHIVKYIDCFPLKNGFNTELCLVMEYCDGKIGLLTAIGNDLSEFIMKYGGKKQYESIYIHIFEQMLEGLHAIH